MGKLQMQILKRYLEKSTNLDSKIVRNFVGYEFKSISSLPRPAYLKNALSFLGSQSDE